jgi:hypothetical protein
MLHCGLELNISMQTTDMGMVLASKALLDSGATDLFINSHFVKRDHLTMKKLSQPIPVYNVDGSLNEAGSISEVLEAVLRFHDHSKHAIFTVTGLGIVFKGPVQSGFSTSKRCNRDRNWSKPSPKIDRPQPN